MRLITQSESIYDVNNPQSELLSPPPAPGLRFLWALLLFLTAALTLLIILNLSLITEGLRCCSTDLSPKLLQTEPKTLWTARTRLVRVPRLAQSRFGSVPFGSVPFGSVPFGSVPFITPGRFHVGVPAAHAAKRSGCGLIPDTGSTLINYFKSASGLL